MSDRTASVPGPGPAPDHASFEALAAEISSCRACSSTAQRARRNTVPPIASIRASTGVVHSSSTSAMRATLFGVRDFVTSSTKSQPTRAVSTS